MTLSPVVGFSLACLRGIAIIITTGLILTPASIVFAVSGRCPSLFQTFWHRTICYIGGVRVTAFGNYPKAKLAMLTANHISYLDILVIGSHVDTHFIAKSEVARWPFIGYFARLIGTVFVERRAHLAAKQCDQLHHHVKCGRSLCLFPESTSSDGKSVLPFKSSLLEVAIQNNLVVQPVTICYHDPLLRYAWYTDVSLLLHVAKVLVLKGVEVDIVFHPSVDSADFLDRKSLSQHIETIIKNELRTRNKF